MANWARVVVRVPWIASFFIVELNLFPERLVPERLKNIQIQHCLLPTGNKFVSLDYLSEIWIAPAWHAIHRVVQIMGYRSQPAVL
ncbi:hypothetical protein AAW31_10520 [Nitrosomonas communis]|uniref:Uncharacterized protein n=1 Tax=Nitrosomonas communis TaxID=44574 RepID=A0A0F7KF49_9PROT|nr:hypothetical protein AAW31_10520 [Nitrosomonas communis]